MCPEVLEGLSWRDAGRSGKRGRQSSERRPFVSGHSHSEVGAKHCCFLSLPSIGTKADADSKVKAGTGVGNWGPQRCFCWGWGDPTGSGQGDREPTAACQPSACSEYHERVRSQGQQLQQLQAELVKLHKEMSSVRAANSEVSSADAACPQNRVQELGSWEPGPVAPPTVQSPPTLEPCSLRPES